MARIRTIKPEFATDEKLAKVSRDARLTFVLCLTQADDDGLIPGNHRQLLAALYPLDDSVTFAKLSGWLEELVDLGRFRWRETVDGSPILEIVNWASHQKVDHKGKSLILPHLKPVGEESPRPSRDIREDDARVSRSDLGPRTMDLGPSASRSVARVKPTGGLDVLPKALCDAGYEAYCRRIGSVEYPRFRKALLPIYRAKTSDHPTAAQLEAAVEAFAEARESGDPKWLGTYTVEKFAQSIHTYVRLGGMPHVDEWGEPTERGRAAKVLA